MFTLRKQTRNNLVVKITIWIVLFLISLWWLQFLSESLNEIYMVFFWFGFSMALRQQQQQQQGAPSTAAEAQQGVNKLNNQPPTSRNYAAPHAFLHSAPRSPAYGPPVPAYVTPHGANLGVDPAAYQQYLHSLYALQPPHHPHRPSWL